MFGEEEGEERLRKQRAAVLAKVLLEAALMGANEEEEEEEEKVIVREEDQRSLSVGIIGAPNAGKSALTNFMVLFFFSNFIRFYQIFDACVRKLSLFSNFSINVNHMTNSFH